MITSELIWIPWGLFTSDLLHMWNACFVFAFLTACLNWVAGQPFLLGPALLSGWLFTTAVFQSDTHTPHRIALLWKQWGNSSSECPPGTEHISPELKSSNKGALSKTPLPTHRKNRDHLPAGRVHWGRRQEERKAETDICLSDSLNSTLKQY